MLFKVVKKELKKTIVVFWGNSKISSLISGFKGNKGLRQIEMSER